MRNPCENMDSVLCDFVNIKHIAKNFMDNYRLLQQQGLFPSDNPNFFKENLSIVKIIADKSVKRPLIPEVNDVANVIPEICASENI